MKVDPGQREKRFDQGASQRVVESGSREHFWYGTWAQARQAGLAGD